jgi:cytochrome c553
MRIATARLITLALLPAALLLSGCSKEQEEARNGAPEAPAEQAAPAADPEAGARLAAERCASFHGEAGIATESRYPHLAGQTAQYLVNALKAYQSGERQSPEMKAVTEGLTEDDFRNLAAHYAAQTLPQGAGLPEEARGEPFEDVDPVALGQQKAAACGGCHGPDGNATIPGTPSLAALGDEYLVLATHAYKGGMRDDPLMAGMVAALSDDDIDLIAGYYAIQPRKARPGGEGDKVVGEQLAGSCTGCHGERGNSKDPKTPSLAGQDAAYLAKATAAYRDGKRKHDTMKGVVESLGDVEIKNLATYFSHQEPALPSARKPMKVSELVERCNRCHGPDGRGLEAHPDFPRIAGQNEAYLVKALNAYHSEVRKNRFMEAMSAPLKNWQIKLLARYYAGK